jgi:peptidyl-prolyl cis-trans isomerase SurA
LHDLRPLQKRCAFERGIAYFGGAYGSLYVKDMILQNSGKVFAVALALMLAALPVRAAEPPGDAAQRTGIAATVNDDAITFSDIHNRLDLYLSGNPQKPPPDIRRKLELQVLDKLIDEKLQLQEAKKDGIAVTDEDIGKGLAQIAKQNHLSPDEFKQKLAAMGVKMSTLTEQIRAEISWTQVVRRKLRPDVNVTESEIDRAMAQMSHSKGRSQYLVAEILLTIPSKEMEDTVRHDADDLIATLKKGGSFPAAARQYSKAPGAAQGGDLGWVQEGSLDPKLDEALHKMQPGQISAPIRTDKGYDILFLRDVHEAGAPAATAAAPQPVASAPVPTAEAPKAEKSEIVHLKQITIPIAATDPEPVVSAKIHRAATLKSEISSCEQMEKKSKDFVDAGTTDLGSGPLNALPEPVRKAVETLAIGELSAPVRGDNGVAVMMVCERSAAPGQGTAAAAPPAPPAPAAAPPAPASADGDDHSRDQVANQIGMKRLDQMQEHYLRDLRATAFIEKRL